LNERRRANSWTWLVAGLLLLSAALVWHDLGAHEVLGRDENATILKLDQPDLKSMLQVVPIKVTGQPGYMQPLYFVLEYYVWPLVHRSAFMLRFLSSAFGLLAVAVTYRLGRALWGREAGLIGAFLTALLPLHLQYSQIARPYSLLALLSLASAYFLVRAWATHRPVYWVGFALAGAFSFYTHYNALFVLASEALFTATLWLAALVAAWQKRRHSLRSGRLVGPLLGWLALGVLCAPGLIQLAGLPWAGLRGGGETGAEVTVQLSAQFFAGFMANSGLASPWLRGLIAGLMAVGLAAGLYRRRWQAALLTVLWLALPFVILAVIKSPRPFVERYLIFVPPMALLLAGQGVAAIGRGLAAWGPLRRNRLAWLGAAATVAFCAGLALLLARPLNAYYAENRAVDRLGETVVVVERNARAGDAVIVSPRFFIRPLAVTGADVLYLTQHLSPAGLDELAARYDRIWLLYTSNLPVELQEPLDQWYLAHRDKFAQVPIKAITALAYRNLALADPEANLQDRIALLEELAPSDHKAEAWLRHGILADAYQALSALYAGQGRSDLAGEYQKRAEETRAEVPSP
jgi:4-amino-4-deoxy-L-arabinose transferase-like glycosyltransferase